MVGTISNDGGGAVLALDGAVRSMASGGAVPLAADAGGVAAGRGSAIIDAGRRIAVIANPRSHRNRNRDLRVPSGIRVREPSTRSELGHVIAELVGDGLDLLIVAGGDGTVRDVLTHGAAIWGANPPVIGVLPRGKTNALAIDLGVPDEAEVADLIEGWQADRCVTRAPIEVAPEGGAASGVPGGGSESVPGRDGPATGFLFGAGVFVDATELAQTTHRFGAVNNLAVALSIFGGMASTFFGSRGSRWRRGRRIAMHHGEGAVARHGAALASDGARFIFLATTMERLPLDIPIFGERRGGLKTLTVDAPPPRLLRNFVQLLRGRHSLAMERDGVHIVDSKRIAIDLEAGFVLDGERFAAGRYVLREGAPLRFASV